MHAITVILVQCKMSSCCEASIPNVYFFTFTDLVSHRINPRIFSGARSQVHYAGLGKRELKGKQKEKRKGKIIGHAKG